MFLNRIVTFVPAPSASNVITMVISPAKDGSDDSNVIAWTMLLDGIGFSSSRGSRLDSMEGTHNTDKTLTIAPRNTKGADRLVTANPFGIRELSWLRGPAITDSDGY